eukprot:gene7317-11636_t
MELNSLVFERMISQLYELINSTKSEKQLEATTKVRILLSEESSPPISRVIEYGFIPIFVKFLNDTTNPKLQFEAAWCLTNIVSSESEHVQAVLKSDAVSTFIKILNESNHVELIDLCIWALGNIAGDSVEFRDNLLQEDVFLSVLSRMISPPSPVILENATWTLSNLVRGSPLPPLSKFESAIPVLTNLLEAKTETDILINICWFFNYISQENVQIIIEHDVLSKLIKILNHKCGVVVQVATRTLGIFSENDHHIKVLIQSNGLIPMKKLIRHHYGAIKKSVIWSLSNMATCYWQNDSLISAGIFQELLEISYSEKSEILKEILYVFSNAVESASKKQIDYLISIGMIEMFLHVLSTRKNYKKIYIIIFEAIEIILEYEDLLTIFENAGGIIVLRKTKYIRSKNILNRFFDE